MMRNKIIILVINLLICFTSLSCQESNVLEYGKSIDLEKIDWEKQNLDSIFAKIVYVKRINFKNSDSIYKGTKLLNIQWYYNYNTDTTLYSNQINDRHFYIIQPNENLLEPYEIYRGYVGASNRELEKKGAFGYYIDKDITFNNVETVSSKKGNLALIRFNTNIEDDYEKAINQYNK